MQIQSGHPLWDEAGLQKSGEKWGKGFVGDESAETEGVYERCLCNRSDIFIEGPPSPSCALQKGAVDAGRWGEAA